MSNLSTLQVMVAPKELLDSIRARGDDPSILFNQSKVLELLGLEVAAFLQHLNDLYNQADTKKIFGFQYPKVTTITSCCDSVRRRVDGYQLEDTPLTTHLGLDEGENYYLEVEALKPRMIVLYPTKFLLSRFETLGLVLDKLYRNGVTTSEISQLDLFTDYIELSRNSKFSVSTEFFGLFKKKTNSNSSLLMDAYGKAQALLPKLPEKVQTNHHLNVIVKRGVKPEQYVQVLIDDIKLVNEVTKAANLEKWATTLTELAEKYKRLDKKLYDEVYGEDSGTSFEDANTLANLWDKHRKEFTLNAKDFPGFAVINPWRLQLPTKTGKPLTFFSGNHGVESWFDDDAKDLESVKFNSVTKSDFESLLNAITDDILKPEYELMNESSQLSKIAFGEQQDNHSFNQLRLELIKRIVNVIEIVTR